mgnify:CR=1 FL=1
MRGVKSVSIRKYITTSMLALVFTMMVIMLIVINIFANMAIKYDIRKTMARELRKNGQYVEYMDGKLIPTEHFQTQDERMYFLVITEHEGICLGSYPEDFELDETKPRMGLSLIKQNHTSYYVLDRVNARLTKTSGQTVFERCVIRKSDTDSEYRTIKHMADFSIPIFLIVALLAGYFIAEKISAPIRQMCEVAEKVGRDENLSQRMEYAGEFQEIAVLTETNNRMLDRLEQMYESQKRFNSNVAHELRTPLTVLSVQCEYAKEQCEKPEEMKQSLEVIGRQIKKCSGIVAQLLQLNKLEQHQVKLDIEYASLDEIIESVCEDEKLQSDRNIEFGLKLGGSEGNIDVILITSVIQNLISNAIKYSKDPVLVEITTKKKADGNYITVRDHGCGMAAEELEKIFAPFYRIERSRNSEGYGLGLSLVEKIIQLHKGTIKVESEPGAGSCFTVYLPF